MGRRRLLLGVGAVVLLGGLALFHWLTAPTPGVTWDNFRRLRKGMSARQVEALLGKPPDGERQRQQALLEKPGDVLHRTREIVFL